MKVSDALADFLAEKNITTVFGIIGSGNAHIFDSIARKGFTEIICVHHEQAAVMAMIAYFRITGQISATLLTTGAGAANGITGVLNAWMDSMPGLIISGNENSKFTRADNPVRIWGTQGYDSTEVARPITKWQSRVMEGEKILETLDMAYHVSLSGRPGPVWVDVPMNIQAAEIISAPRLKNFPVPAAPPAHPKLITNLHQGVDTLLDLLKKAKRPVLWLGNGLRLAKAQHLVRPLVEKLQIPTLVTWSAIDLLPSEHPLNFGRAGVYGQRAGNFVVQNCDLLISLGTRMAIPQIGYQIDELARDAKIVAIDIDAAEVLKYESRVEYPILADAKDFTEIFLEKCTPLSISPWQKICENYRQDFPWVEPELSHPDREGFINSYPFMERLCHYFKKDQIIVTDMGTALLSGHQVIKVKEGQTLFTSLGLGEMGFGLPGAIGASFARNRGEVLCLNCDGGMMMNLQEWQTVAHHQLPIKMIIFNNDGYLMIKHTQKSILGGRQVGVNKKSGVSCPDYQALAIAFNFKHFQIRTWQDVEEVLPLMQEHHGPVVCEVFMHPEQLMVPKLGLVQKSDGSIVSPPIEDLSPPLSKEVMEKAMLIGMHPKSIQLRS